MPSQFELARMHQILLKIINSVKFRQKQQYIRPQPMCSDHDYLAKIAFQMEKLANVSRVADLRNAQSGTVHSLMYAESNVRCLLKTRIYRMVFVCLCGAYVSSYYIIVHVIMEMVIALYLQISRNMLSQHDCCSCNPSERMHAAYFATFFVAVRATNFLSTVHVKISKISRKKLAYLCALLSH